MKIKNFKKIEKNGIIAVFDVELNKDLTINSFKLAEGKKGQFVALRSIKNFKDEWESIGYMSSELSERIKELVKAEMGEVQDGK